MQAAGLGNEDKLPKEAERGQPKEGGGEPREGGVLEAKEGKCSEEEGVIRCVRYC